MRFPPHPRRFFKRPIKIKLPLFFGIVLIITIDYTSSRLEIQFSVCIAMTTTLCFLKGATQIDQLHDRLFSVSFYFLHFLLFKFPEVQRFLFLASLAKQRCPTLWLEGRGRPLVNKPTHHCRQKSAVYQPLRPCRCPASDNRATDGESVVISCFATSVSRRHWALQSKTTDALFPFLFFFFCTRLAKCRRNHVLPVLSLPDYYCDVTSSTCLDRQGAGSAAYHVRYDHQQLLEIGVAIWAWSLHDIIISCTFIQCNNTFDTCVHDLFNFRLHNPFTIHVLIE